MPYEKIIMLLSFMVTLSGFIFSLKKYNDQRSREYADKIRTSAAMVIAKLERQKAISLAIFYDIQPVLVDVDSMLTHSDEQVATMARDELWKNIVSLYSISLKKILDEEIEISYVDLYGYLPDIRDLYLTSVKSLRDIYVISFEQLKNETQDDILEFCSSSNSIESAIIGNMLRTTTSKIEVSCNLKMQKVVEIFRDNMLNVIEAKDKEIFSKKIDLSKFQKKIDEEEIKEMYAKDLDNDLNNIIKNIVVKKLV